MSDTKINEITLNGEDYVRKDSVRVKQRATELDGMPYVIIRTSHAGIHAGYLKQKDGPEVTLMRSRRIWKWVGAATLSQLSQDGPSKPDECKIPCEVDDLQLQWIEILPCTEKARIALQGVAVWEV